MSEYVLVPKVATEEMALAVYRQAGFTPATDKLLINVARIDYAAAIAARPAVPDSLVEEWAKVLCEANGTAWDSADEFLKNIHRGQARALLAHLGETVG